MSSVQKDYILNKSLAVHNIFVISINKRMLNKSPSSIRILNLGNQVTLQTLIAFIVNNIYGCLISNKHHTKFNHF